MTLRAILSLASPGRKPFRAWALGSSLALLLATALGVSPASATVQSIEVVPASPTTCDSVAVIVKGVMPNPCYTLLRVRLGELKVLPTMGPLPSYSIGVRIVVQEPNPNVDVACPEVLQPYERKLYLPYHPVGSYAARATEYLVPYSTDSTAVPKDSTSRVDTHFFVQSDSCPTPGCYLLRFDDRSTADPFCDAVGPPGGTACVDIGLHSREAVAGFQSIILVSAPRIDPVLPIPGSAIHPVSVEAIGDARGMQVSWTADESTVRFLLFSPDGKGVSLGGKVLRVCYAIGSETATGPYLLRFGHTVVSDPRGNAIPPCPTFTEEVGRLCVGDGGCDLDGNGVSNILDIIRLVRCALHGSDSTDVCPDTTAAHADCNDDGVVDVRDVICCIRNILRLTRWGLTTPPIDPSAEPTRVRFVGSPEWLSSGYGRVEIEMAPGRDFGGVGVEVEAAPGTQIVGMEENDGTVDPGMSSNPVYLFAPEVGDGQRSRFLIVRRSGDYLPTRPFRTRLTFRTVDALGRDAAFRIVGAEGGSWSQASPASAEITQSTLLVGTGTPTPRVFPARPNPFTDATDISYEIPAPRHVTLRVYSVTGKLVRTLVDATVPQGLHRAPWNGRDSAGRVVSSGIYFVKLSDGSAESTIRIMRLK